MNSSFFISLFTIIFMIFLGYSFKRINFLKADDVELLNKIVMNIALPCMIFQAIYAVNLDSLPSLCVLPIIGVLTSFCIGIVAFFVLKVLKYDNKHLWSIVLCVIMGNTAFMGYPIVLGAFGNSGFVSAIFFDICTTVTFLLMSFLLIVIFGGSYKSAFIKAISLPPLWGLILGILFNIFNIPIGDFVGNIVGDFAALTIPLIMLSLGLSIKFEGILDNKFTVIIVSFVKLFVYPLVALFILLLFGVNGLNFDVVVLQSCMPTGMLALVLSISYNLDFKLTSDCIFTDTLLSLLTIPLIIYLL